MKQFNVRATWTGKLVLTVEEEYKPVMLDPYGSYSHHGALTTRVRDATAQDLPEFFALVRGKGQE